MFTLKYITILKNNIHFKNYGYKNNILILLFKVKIKKTFHILLYNCK